MNIGENINKKIKESGKTQSEISKETKISQPTLSTWINNNKRPGIEKLIKLADSIGCSIDELVGRNRPAPQKETEKKEEPPGNDSPGEIELIDIYRNVGDNEKKLIKMLAKDIGIYYNSPCVTKKGNEK